MRVALVVAASKYTGAAAVAEHTTRALRLAGADARLLFLAGRNLAERLADAGWAWAGLAKERSPGLVRSNLRAVRTVADPADVVLSFLPHDHLLCVVAGVHRRCPLVRCFRNLGHLRGDPYHRLLNRRLAGAVLAHGDMAARLATLRPGLPAEVHPVPLEDRFGPAHDPATWRGRLGIPADARVLGMVGKVAPGRGFDLLLRTAARVEPEVHVLIVGHGEARPGLERLADRLGLTPRLHWAGYQELELPALYAAMDIVLYPAQGSDHGHRAISEAQACGRPVVAAGLPGVPDLVEDSATGLLAEPDPASLAFAVGRMLQEPERARRIVAAARRAVEARRFLPCGTGLLRFLRSLQRGTSRVESGS
jgi:glycosyltransferase involved in cell wall biosynthesis